MKKYLVLAFVIVSLISLGNSVIAYNGGRERMVERFTNEAMENMFNSIDIDNGLVTIGSTNDADDELTFNDITTAIGRWFKFCIGIGGDRDSYENRPVANDPWGYEAFGINGIYPIN